MLRFPQGVSPSQLDRLLGPTSGMYAGASTLVHDPLPMAAVAHCEAFSDSSGLLARMSVSPFNISHLCK